jgi:hypothetical protein
MLLLKRMALVMSGVLCLWALLPATGGRAMPAAMPATRSAHTAPRIIFYPSLPVWSARRHRGYLGTGNLVYYDGPVMPSAQVYLVFWGTGFSAAYERIITGYFTDVGNTAFARILTQYDDTASHIHPAVNLAGVWSDASAPPTASSCRSINGTAYPAISDTDIQAEVARAITSQGWPDDRANGYYAVYTPPNASVNAAGQCAYSDFCAYHSYTGTTPGTGVAYAAMPFPTPPSHTALVPCYGAGGQTYPNGDPNGDAAVNLSSHEQFEAQSNPLSTAPGATGLTAWNDTSNDEIGDKCAWSFPPSSITTLNNGHGYSVQTEWSNARGTCVNSFTAPAHWPDTGAVYRPATGAFYLRLTNTTGYADLTLPFGAPGDLPLVGDWTGQGYRSIGVFRAGSFYLRNSNTLGPADLVFPFGSAGDLPVVGDWTGQGRDTIGVYRNGTWYLRNENRVGSPDIMARFGTTGDLPVVGDWTGQGRDTIGVYRPATGMFYLSTSNTTPAADIVVRFGPLGAQPVVGDWTGNGLTTIGVSSGGRFLLHNSNTTGNADIAYYLGVATDQPFAGAWVTP